MKSRNDIKLNWGSDKSISALVRGKYTKYLMYSQDSTVAVGNGISLHCALSLAAQHIVIGPVCGFVIVFVL